MKIRQLIKRLNEIVEANPENAEIEIKWWDSFRGHFSIGDGLPVQLFYYPFMKKTICVLNAVDGTPSCYVAVSDKRKKDDEGTTRNA